MRILTANSRAPNHIVLTRNPAELNRILEPEINLVACFIEPCLAFNQFAANARRFDMDEHYVLNHAAPNDMPEYPISSQMKHVFDRMIDEHHGVKGAPIVNQILRQFVSSFCAITEAEELSVRLRGKIADDLPTVRPHTDAIVEIRGLADLSPIGMACFDQTGLSPSEVQAIGRKSYSTTDFTETTKTYNNLSERLLLVQGPVLMLFKGLQSGNPLLHATIPQALMSDEQKAVPFRACWRVDSYHR